MCIYLQESATLINFYYICVCLIHQLIAMDKLSGALMLEILRMKASGASKLRIQLLQQKLDKLQRQADDKQSTSRND